MRGSSEEVRGFSEEMMCSVIGQELCIEHPLPDSSTEKEGYMRNNAITTLVRDFRLITLGGQSYL